MTIPERIPGLRLATIALAVYTAVWIPLEGALWQVLVMGVGGTAVALGHMAQRWLSGRVLHTWHWLLLAAAGGLTMGSGSSLMTLLFMAVKTGLHAHGPEFSAAEIAWVWAQLPLWGVIGLLAGMGLGMMAAAIMPSQDT